MPRLPGACTVTVASGSRSPDIPWLVLRAELVGTAALVLVGLSLVILMFGEAHDTLEWRQGSHSNPPRKLDIS